MDRFKRSAKYSVEWMKQNQMGPNSVWLTEYLTEEILIDPNMKILDLGCGKAMSSIFLAKEYQAQVWACDLWITPTENHKNILEQNITDLVYPIYAEAHSLPFAESFFDIILSVDAYHYFGTDETYLLYILKYLKQGGILGMVSPGFKKEIDEIPQELKDFWLSEFYTLHSVEWWKNHWQKTGLVNVEIADELSNGWQYWYDWEKDLIQTNPEIIAKRGSDIDLLEKDGGKNLIFPRIIAKKL